MGLFEKIAKRAPRGLGMALMNISALWGFRSPPEPTVVPHMIPVKGPEGPSEDPDREGPRVYRPRARPAEPSEGEDG